MRKVFLAIAALSFAAACAMIVRQKGIRQPYYYSSLSKSDKGRHHEISQATFSPDGEKLIFLVYDESGPHHATQTYLYSLPERTVRRLPTNEEGWISGIYWSSDSIHFGFNRSKSRGRMADGRVFNVDTDTIEEAFKIGLVGWSPDGSRQLFHDLYSDTDYIRTVGRSSWLTLPDEMKGMWLHWSSDGNSLLYVDRERCNIMQYSIGEKALTNIALFKNYHVNPSQLYPSRSPNLVYFVAPRKPEEYRGVVLRKLDLRTGEITEVFDTGLDPKEDYIRKLFLTLEGNPLYYTQSIAKDTASRLIRLDTTMRETKVILEGKFIAWDYSPSKNVFALSFLDNRRMLKLFHVDTGTMEEIFRAD